MSASIVSRLYSGFRGVDFRGDETQFTRSPDSLNVWKDYKETDSIRTRPGMKLSVSFGEPVYGVFFFNGAMLVHSGTKLYKVAAGKTTRIYSGLKAASSDSFIYNNLWYFKDGKNYLVYDGTTVKEVVGYVPTTSISRKPAGGGTIYEDVNLLSNRRINTFLADGKSKEYFLDAQKIDPGFKPIVKVNDAAVKNFTVDHIKGKIMFETAPPAPKTDGQDNVSIEFQKTVSGYANRILNCTMLQVFDNRVFFSGNKEFPNTVYHSSLDDPSYCSDLDYYHEGLDKAAIKGMVAGNNALWVFREPSQANTTVFYHTPTIDAEYGKIYPSQHSSVTTGCVGKAVNFNDDIVFFSDRGLEGISGDITTEQVVAHRSSLVDRKMTAESGYKNMVLAEWEGYLLVFIGKKVYLADSRTGFTNLDHNEYEWFYWNLEKDVLCTRVDGGVLYLGTQDGVYTMSDYEADIENYWVTPKDKFKYPNMLKTTNKRGSLVEATGDFAVYAKTEKTGFELIGEYKGVTDYNTCRMKVKKFKDLQLKFHSMTRFSLESATVEAFIGGYIKR
ncbi:MAG: hypothetical protein II354_02265 [Firmicutes bacterium]|nr:hypothetical protein [Bacillota bacterium]